VNNTTHNNNTTIAELKGRKGKQAKKKTDIDAVEDHHVGPGDNKHGSPDPHSDEKLKRTGSADTNQKKGGKVSDPVTKGKVSDDKESRSSQSLDSEKDGKVIR
jgi:hypothetical protein